MKEKKGRDRKLGTEAEEGKRNQYEKVRQQYMQNEKSVEGTRNTTSYLYGRDLEYGCLMLYSRNSGFYVLCISRDFKK